MVAADASSLMNVTRPRIPRVVVHRRDRRIGAVAFGLGSEAEHEEAGDESSQPDHKGDRPRTGERAGSEAIPFPDGQGRLVAADRLKEQLRRDPGERR